MRIFHVISSLDIGGAECFVRHLANAQVKKHNVGLVLLRKGKPGNLTFEKDLSPGILVFKMDCVKKYSLVLAIKLTQFLKRQQPDVIHVHLHNPFYYVYISSYFIKRVRFIHTMHSSLFGWHKTLKLINLLRMINNKFIHVCLTDSIYNDTFQKYPNLKLSLIYNGISPYQVKRTDNDIESLWKKFDPESKMHRFLAIGNISKPKNYPFLCKVFKSLKEKNISAILLIIGQDNAIEQNIVEEINKIGSENVFFVGPLRNAPDFLMHAEALLLGSLYEGMPMTVIESFSLGRPVISTPAGGVSDMIKDEVNGYLLKDWSIDNYTHRLIDFITSSEDKKNIMRKNSNLYYIENLQIDKISEKYIQIYDIEK
jgi:glycosyltransferase involved in cell wall biosynthesis